MSSIPLERDPIVTELETICKTRLAMPVTFIEADLNEANFGLDQLKGIDFPVLIHVATTRNRYRIQESHNLIRTAKVVCMLLTKQSKDGDTKDYSSYNLSLEINRMRQLGENLVYWINKSSKSVAGGVEDWESDNVMQEFDSHLFGQAITFDWTLDTGKTGYYNVAP